MSTLTKPFATSSIVTPATHITTEVNVKGVNIPVAIPLPVDNREAAQAERLRQAAVELARYESAQAAEKAAKAAKDEAANNLKTLLGDDKELYLPSAGKTVSRVVKTSRSVDPLGFLALTAKHNVPDSARAAALSINLTAFDALVKGGTLPAIEANALVTGTEQAASISVRKGN